MPKEKIEMMIKLAASIEPSLKTFEDDGNYVKVRFKDSKTPKEQIIEDLHLVGIKEIDSIRSNKDCHVFTLKFRGTSQRKIIVCIKSIEWLGWNKTNCGRTKVF